MRKYDRFISIIHRYIDTQHRVSVAEVECLGPKSCEKCCTAVLVEHVLAGMHLVVWQHRLSGSCIRYLQ